MDNLQEMGELLTRARLEKGLSLGQLAAVSGLNKSSIMRLERGKFAAPGPDSLSRLAEALGLAAADLFALAGYSTPRDIPTLRPYLRAKYGQLPEAAIAEVEAYLAAVAAQYGGVDAGPVNGEDEQPE